LHARRSLAGVVDAAAAAAALSLFVVALENFGA
jgi:hypothetical protein